MIIPDDLISIQDGHSLYIYKHPTRFTINYIFQNGDDIYIYIHNLEYF